MGLQISRLETPVNDKTQTSTPSILQFTVIKPQPPQATVNQSIQKLAEDKNEENMLIEEKTSKLSDLSENGKKEVNENIIEIR